MGYALSGKTALVTGANRGIGEAIVDALVAAGVRKVYAAARSISALGPLVARHGSRVTPLQLDVTNAAQIAAAAATAADVDLLVNNAGIVGFFGGEFTDPKWIEGGRQEMEVNFLGTFAVTQAFAPVLAKNGGGAIANLNSVASFVSFPILAAYSASKAATHSLTQVTRAMLRGQNTQVFGVYPGPIDTKMGEVLTLEKASPADAARAIVAGIIAGDEEIFPDRMSQGTGPAFFADPKGLERQVAGVPAVAYASQAAVGEGAPSSMALDSSRETTSMKAFILDRYGSADRVRAGDMPDPELREDDVLVQIHAAGVNLLDSKIRNGEFKLILRYRLPLILGHDVAGVVVRVGSRVRRFKPGDEVYARPADGRIGAFAEFSAIKEDDVAIKPKALTMEEAASIPLVGLTAWQALIERASLKQGQKVLIHAGSGGVGTFAIQLAKHVGATVATTTSTANVDLVRSLGADIVIDYKKEDFAHVLRDYDVVLHSLDKVTLEKSLRVLKPGGQLISISGPPDAAFARSIGASWVLRMIMGALSYGITAKAKRRHAQYSFLFMRANGGQLTEITSLIDDGIIRPVVDRVFPFASTKEAMAYVEAGRAKGKVVVSLK